MADAVDDARARRRTVRRVAFLALVALLGWAGWAGYEVALAVGEGRAGSRLARDAVQRAADGELADRGPIDELRKAQDHFETARRRLRSVPVRAAGFLPILGRQLREVAALSDAAAQLADVSADTLDDAQAALQAPRSSGPERVAVLRALSQVAGEGERRAARIRISPGRDLARPVREQHDILAKQVNRAHDTFARAAAGADAMATLLDGPRRYLVLAANNSEMRAGSGMFLSIGEIRTAGGTLSLQPFTPASDLVLPPPGAPVSGDFADRWGWLEPGREWRNLAATPRFEESASLAADMWERAGRGRVDGVLAVDPVFLSAIVDAVGPVVVAGRELDGPGVRQWILHDQYVEHASDPPDQRARREQLGAVAATVLSTLEDRSWDAGRMGRSVAAAARARHVLVWSGNSDEQRGWEAAGVAGRLQESSLLVSVLNRGGNKLDRFLAVDIDVRCTRGSGTTEGVVTIRLRNDVPPGEPPYVAGPDPNSGVGEGVYLGILAVNLPGFSGHGRIDGVTSLAVAGRDGPTRVVGAEVVIPRGEARTYVVRFDLPRDPGGLRLEPTARVPAPTRTEAGKPLESDDSPQIVCS